MRKPIQIYFPELPPPLKGGEGTEVEGVSCGGRSAKRPTPSWKSATQTSGLPEALSVVRFLRWFADRLFPCPLCGEVVEDSEYSAFYRAEGRTVAMNLGHARCREADNAKRIRRVSAPCGCVLLAPTLVRVVSCSCEHNATDCGCEHKIGTVQAAPVRERG